MCMKPMMSIYIFKSWLKSEDIKTRLIPIFRELCQISSVNCSIFVCVSSSTDVFLARLFENSEINEGLIEIFCTIIRTCRA